VKEVKNSVNLSMRPPRNDVAKVRPATSGAGYANFYIHPNNQATKNAESVKSNNEDIISLSVERNQLKLSR
jgi:hypothetical protein